MQIISLCSGSKGNCSIIRHKNTVIMVDCGASQKYIKQRMSELSLRFDQIDAVLFTHDHIDHIRSIKMCADVQCFSWVKMKETKEIQPFEPMMIKNLKITAMPLSHDAQNTVGYLFEEGTEKLVYMTDTGYVPKKILPLIHNADIYFIESNHDIEMLMKTSRPQHIKARIYGDRGHLCNEDCAAVLRQIVGPSTKEIILAHLSEEANKPELAYNITSQALRFHPLCSNVKVKVAGQFEVCMGGKWNEEDHNSFV